MWIRVWCIRIVRVGVAARKRHRAACTSRIDFTSARCGRSMHEVIAVLLNERRITRVVQYDGIDGTAVERVVPYEAVVDLVLGGPCTCQRIEELRLPRFLLTELDQPR